MIQFVLGKHEVFELIGGINGAGILSGVWVCLETRAFILKSLEHLDVEFVTFVGRTGKIPAIKVVDTGGLLDGAIDLLLSN